MASTVKSLVSEMGHRAEALEAEPKGVERWYSRDDLDDLSMEEARVLADRLISQMDEAEEPGLRDIDRSAALAFVQEALLSGFRSAAETGEIDPGSFRPPQEFERLTPEQRASLIGLLRRSTEGAGPHG